MKLLLYCLLAMLWPVANSIAQNRTANIRPLTVGDTLPPDLILENVTNYPDSKIRMSDLKGKLVILDFWGKHCAPCILALAKLDSLQQASHGKVQVITISDFENKDELYKTLRRFTQTQNLSLPVILGNEQLISYFPYTLVSHLVWIDGTGSVKAITGGEYITGTNMQEILDGKPVDWPVKKDVLDYDYKKPLLDYTQVEQSRPASIFYSAFTSRMNGVAPPAGTTINNGRNVSFTAFYNYTLLDFCQLSLDYRVGASRQQFVLQVSDTTRYIKPKESLLSAWKEENTYCYYIQLPIATTKKSIQETVKKDLTRWLHLLGITVKKKCVIKNGIETTMYIVSDSEQGVLKPVK